jgi:hypothetical protein
MARCGRAFKTRVAAGLLPPNTASMEEAPRAVGVSADTVERWRAGVVSAGPARRGGHHRTDGRRRWLSLYLIVDLYSRTLVGWEVRAEDHADHAAKVAHRTALAEGIAAIEPPPAMSRPATGDCLKPATSLRMNRP